ncbi:MAG: hypothetical protein SNH35_06585 [Rikenellaceae bacterium]
MSLVIMGIVAIRMLRERVRYDRGEYRYRDEYEIVIGQLRPNISFCSIPLFIGLLLVMGGYIFSL